MGVDINEDTVKIFTPVVVGRKGEYYQLLYDLLGKGYESAKVDGKVMSLREQVILAKHKKHSISALVDEILVALNLRAAKTSIARAFKRGC